MFKKWNEWGINPGSRQANNESQLGNAWKESWYNAMDRCLHWQPIEKPQKQTKNSEIGKKIISGLGRGINAAASLYFDRRISQKNESKKIREYPLLPSSNDNYTDTDIIDGEFEIKK